VSAGKKKTQQKRKFSCTLHAHSQFLCSLVRLDLANRGVRHPVQPQTYAHDVMRVVLLPCFNAQPDIFAVMNCCVVALIVFSSDIFLLRWSADILCVIALNTN